MLRCVVVGVCAGLAAATSAAARADSSGCPGAPAAGSATPVTSSQLVSVTAASSHATVGVLVVWQRSRGCWRRQGGPWTVRLGFAGLSANRREGDGTTPIGVFPLGDVIYGVARDPGVRYPYHRLVCGDWWDEDPASAAYNSFQHVPCGAQPPFRRPSEALWESTRAYRYLAVVDFNTGPAIPGRGSGIFIHADLGHPTNGCISLPPARLVALLRWLDPAAHPRVAIEVRSRP